MRNYRRLACVLLAAFVFVVISSPECLAAANKAGSGQETAAADSFDPKALKPASDYFKETFVQDGKTIVRVLVPGRPPKSYRAPAVKLPAPDEQKAVNVLVNVPVFDWCYGCSATSAAMMMGHYDNGIFPNMYSGPTNGGVCPMTNATWGAGECPLSATHMGYDNRPIRGNVDDYWGEPDPFIVYGWTEHTHEDCTADFMGTSQTSNAGVGDGGTWFFFDPSGAPLVDYTGSEPTYRDGCHGMRLFVESRGYTVDTNYTQLIYGYGGNTQGFTFNDYMTEIDAGRPVMIQVAGHSMLGVGYNDAGNIVYLHDTWDHSVHTMTWGGEYSSMEHYAVTVLKCEWPPRFILTYPSDAGITLERGTTTYITWEADPMPNGMPIGHIRIELIDDEGGSNPETWVLASAARNTGQWRWRVGSWRSRTQAAYPDGDDYTIRISAPTLGGVILEDSSDNPFAIGTLQSVQVIGAAGVDEFDSAQYVCVANYNFGPSIDVADQARWNLRPRRYASITTDGLLTAKEVQADQPCTITATYGRGRNRCNDSLDITIREARGTVTSLDVTGGATLDELDSAQYTCTANFDYGPPLDVTAPARWRIDATRYARMSQGGLLTAKNTMSDQRCMIAATYGRGRNACTGSLEVLLLTVRANVNALVIDGPTSVYTSSSAHYTCTAHYDYGPSLDVTDSAHWSVNAWCEDANGRREGLAHFSKKTKGLLITTRIPVVASSPQPGRITVRYREGRNQVTQTFPILIMRP